MSPRKRNAGNRPHPTGWRWKNGAWRYRVPKGQEHQWDGKREATLGATLADAYRTWTERIRDDGDLRTFADLADRYSREVVPQKAPKTQQSNRISLARLRPVFGSMPPGAITPQHARRYRDIVRQKHGATSANRDHEVLSHLLTTAVDWGIIDRNQLLGQVKKLRTPPRDRLVEDWEIEAALAIAPPLLAGYIRLKLMTGLRRGDLLSLRLTALRDDGIHVQPRKTAGSTGKRLIFAWDAAGELQTVVDQLKRLPPRRIGAAPLFVTRQGKPYIKADGSCNAFDSLWQRFMDKVMRETATTDRWQERDLRAKVASESSSLTDASERLGHSGTEITRRVYRRKPVTVTPLKLSHSRNGTEQDQ